MTNPRMDQPIRELMTFDHVVAVMPDGRVIDTDEKFGRLDVHAPEVWCDYEGPFAEAQISDQNDRDMVTYLKSQGWEVLDGYSAQYNYSGPTMHASEFIGGSIEERIREEPGFWVALMVELHPNEDDPEHEENGGSGGSEYGGWIVARKIGSEDEIAARTEWIAEDVSPFDVDPSVRRRPMSDEHAQMASPVVIYRGPDQRAAFNAMINHLLRISNMSHVVRAGEQDAFVLAAEKIAAGEFSVKPAHRIMRVRAMLMPEGDGE